MQNVNVNHIKYLKEIYRQIYQISKSNANRFNKIK